MPTRYIDSTDFSTASAVWDSAAKTNKAPDQWYSYCGVARQQVSGVLGPAFICGTTSDNCAVRCADTIVNGYFGVSTLISGGVSLPAGMYRRRITRTSGKAAVRVEINTQTTALSTIFPAAPMGFQVQQVSALNGSVNPNRYPIRGTSCKNMSPAYFATAPAVTGPISERLFGAIDGCYSGTNSIAEYLYNEANDPLGLQSSSPRGNAVNATLGASKLVLAGQNPTRSVFYLTPSGGEDIDLLIWNPCTQTPGADVTVNVFCSNTLREFTAYYQGAGAGEPCAAGADQRNIFLGNVQNQIGGQIGLYDWTFSDFMANGVRPDGYYYLPVQAGITTHIKIKVLNGIIVQIIDPCAT